jgi:hypothetical protein
MERFVFISYRRSDVGLARALAELLEVLGTPTFLDVRSIRLGQAWEPAILLAARSAHTMLVLWSRNAAGSSYMRQEWAVASTECRIIPVRLDGSELPPELAPRQAVDLTVSERLLARMAELARAGVSRTAASAQLVQELRRDGVELEPKQRRALEGAVAAFGALSFGALAWSQRRWLHRVASRAGLTVAASLGAAAFLFAREREATDALEACSIERDRVTRSLPTHSGAGGATHFAGQGGAPPADGQGASPSPGGSMASGTVSGPSEAPVRPLPPRITPTTLELETLPLKFQERATRQLILSNPNPVPLSIDWRLTPGLQPNLSLAAEKCRQLPAGGTCAVQLIFDAGSELFPKTIPISASIEASGARANVTGTLAPLRPVPLVVPSRLTLQSLPLSRAGTQDTQLALTSQIVTVTNGGTGGLQLEAHAPSPFEVVSECQGVLAPKASCKLSVRLLRPETRPKVGTVRGELALRTNASAEPIRIPLAGSIQCRVPDVSFAGPVALSRLDRVVADKARTESFPAQVKRLNEDSSSAEATFDHQEPKPESAAPCGSTVTAFVRLVPGLF